MSTARHLALATALITMTLGGTSLAQSSGSSSSPAPSTEGTAPGMERGDPMVEPAPPIQPGTRGDSPNRPLGSTPSSDSVAVESRIRSMLEAQGYANVTNIRRDGDAFVASATKDGLPVTVRVDPQLGQIQEHGG